MNYRNIFPFARNAQEGRRAIVPVKGDVSYSTESPSGVTYPPKPVTGIPWGRGLLALLAVGASAFGIYNGVEAVGYSNPAPVVRSVDKIIPTPIGNQDSQVNISATPGVYNSAIPVVREINPSQSPDVYNSAIKSNQIVSEPIVISPILTINSYDFARSLGLEADYLKELYFDGNTKEFIKNLNSLPPQMREIAERSGLIGKLLVDKQITADEAGYFNRLTKGYMKEIDVYTEERAFVRPPWLKQLPEEQVTEALAVNLRNFLEIDGYNLYSSDRVSTLLPNALFLVDGERRMYAAEVNNPNWHSILPYASAMVKNITQSFSGIRSKALEVANNPDYRSASFPDYGRAGFLAQDLLAKGYFELEAVGSTDKGENAAEDINLLLERGSPPVQGALRLYAHNLSDGQRGSAEQARVELTILDGWSIGIDIRKVLLDGHDVIAVPLAPTDEELLLGRSKEPLLIIRKNGSGYLPIQWTRINIVDSRVNIISFYDGVGAENIKISTLKDF